MCGIVGYIGARDASQVLLEGLERLEYRGYDSSGVAIVGGGKISVRKEKGRLSQLRERLKAQPAAGNAGIGHTRWATHGEPSQVNSHPHTDAAGEIAVVHNGIIENHARIRAFLQKEGCRFVSQTDTEVVAHLIRYYYAGDLRAAMAQALTQLTGSYALAVVYAKEPDAIYCARKDSPLVIGTGKGENFVASDIPAILPCTRDIAILEENCIARVTAREALVYDAQGRCMPIHTQRVNWDAASAEKGGFAHFMLKEIHEQPRALADTFGAYVDKTVPAIRSDGFPDEQRARTLRRVVIVACGTAYHAGMAGARMIEAMTDLDVCTDVASEFRYRRMRLGPDDLMVIVSQSGETADTLSALREGKRQGVHVLAITNVVGSTASREADSVLYTRAGPEIAVASTKAYITQLMIFALLALSLARSRASVDAARYAAQLRALEKLPEQARSLIAQSARVEQFAALHAGTGHVFYIGRGMDYALALEGSLKLKEISYIFSEAYAAGELKHGTIALIEKGTPVVALMTQKRLREKMDSNIREVCARGAAVLCIRMEGIDAPESDVCASCWEIPETDALLSPMLGVIPLQLLAYYMAVARGCDVDKPRNLAKSVTVE